MYSEQDTAVCSGFPHSEIDGSKVVRTSPSLIAAYHVFHRLLMPRHPPNALKTLYWDFIYSDMYSHASVYREIHRDTFRVSLLFLLLEKSWKNLVLTLLFTISMNDSTKAELRNLYRESPDIRQGVSQSFWNFTTHVSKGQKCATKLGSKATGFKDMTPQDSNLESKIWNFS